MNEMRTAAMDSPDLRDFSYSSIRLGGNQEELPEEVLPDYVAPVLDQGNTMRCTLFSAAGATMSMNAREAIIVGVPDYKQTNGIELLNEAIKEGFSERDGWYVQSAIKLYVKHKYVEGYAYLPDAYAVKRALADGKRVCTGSNSISWTDVYGKYAVIQPNSPGHAFMIDGYDKEGFIIKDSRGTQTHLNGYFVLKFADFNYLFTCYALLDESDAPQLYAQYAKMKGWSHLEEFHPNSVCTRLFGAMTISKATDTCLKDIFDVSERRAEMPMTATAFQTIFSKTGKKIEVPETNVLKRWELIKMIKTYL